MRLCGGAQSRPSQPPESRLPTSTRIDPQVANEAPPVASLADTRESRDKVVRFHIERQSAHVSPNPYVHCPSVPEHITIFQFTE